MLYTFDWSVDGVTVQSSSNDTLDGTQYFDKGQTITVTVTASDGITSVSQTSAPVTCGNSTPTPPTLALAPVSPIEGSDDLVCSIDASASDDDGDSLLTSLVDGRWQHL